MLDDLFCCLRSLIFGAKNLSRIVDSLSVSVVWWWCYHMHTNGYAVYGRVFSLSVTCQVATVNAA